MVATITPLQLKSGLDSPGAGSGRLIDVRTPAEYAEAHVRGADNVPLDQLDPEQFDPTAHLIVICRSGSRGKMACERLLAAGHENVVNVEGGTLACEQAGLPLIRGKQTMSLERQVRIAAGSLVLFGVIAGWALHPVGYALSAFVGAGLIFAGVTDTCGMGMLLARMPWNQAGPPG